MIYYVDIDETICRYEGERNYPDAVPMQDRIDKINALSFCSNKCLQSTPGLGIVIWRKNLKTYNKNYYLNLILVAKCFHIQMHQEIVLILVI